MRCSWPRGCLTADFGDSPKQSCSKTQERFYDFGVAENQVQDMLETPLQKYGQFHLIRIRSRRANLVKLYNTMYCKA